MLYTLPFYSIMTTCEFVWKLNRLAVLRDLLKQVYTFLISLRTGQFRFNTATPIHPVVYKEERKTFTTHGFQLHKPHFSQFIYLVSRLVGCNGGRVMVDNSEQTPIGCRRHRDDWR